MSAVKVEGLLDAGRVGRPHGLDGSFYVAQPRVRLLTLGQRVRVAGAMYEIVRRAGTDARPILRFGDHESREAIEPLRGQELFVCRQDAPPLGPDEWYAEDLEGCRVVDGLRDVGTVRRLLPYPSCELLEVARSLGGDLLVPLIGDAVRDVDIANRRIDVNVAFLNE